MTDPTDLDELVSAYLDGEATGGGDIERPRMMTFRRLRPAILSTDAQASDTLYAFSTPSLVRRHLRADSTSRLLTARRNVRARVEIHDGGGSCRGG